MISKKRALVYLVILAAAVAADKGCVFLFSVVRKRVVSSDTSVSSFECADLECHIPGNNSIVFPFFHNLDFERLELEVEDLIEHPDHRGVTDDPFTHHDDPPAPASPSPPKRAPRVR